MHGRRHTWLLLLGAAGLAACGSDHPPPPGHAEVIFLPQPVSVTDLTLTKAVIRLDHVFVVGDGPPPMGPPTPGLEIDLLGSGATIEDHAPQGLYSRVTLDFHDADLAGTWKGTPFTAHLDAFGPIGYVDLRSATAQELVSGSDISFTVDIDVASWFAGAILDGATPENGQISCDEMNNPMIAMTLAARVHDSFSLP